MPAGPRTFHAIRQRGDNELNSNLTELSATKAVDNGFLSHTDWQAHLGRYMYALKTIQKLSHSGTKPINVLDVGCGDMSLPMLAYRNRQPADWVKDYWGLDLRANPKWAEKIGWGAPMTLVRLDLVQDDPTTLLGWPTAGFDLTVNFEVFEHVPTTHQRKLVENLFKWTRPGGRVLFSTPNAGVSDSTADNHCDPVTGKSREMSYEAKLDLVCTVGFKVLETYGTFGRMDRIPVAELLESSPVFQDAKEYLPHAWYMCFVAAAFPDKSNNAIFVMEKPRNG